MKNLILLFFSALAWGCCETPKHEISLRPSEYVTTLVGTQSDYSLSTGNTYPAVALPWGMNFWTPQTGKMGDGWAYTYGSHTIRGLKQTHQPSPWINDYGQFSIMPVRGKDKVDENARQSWFSHQSETAKPYYYSVYLADHDVVAEMAPTDRAAVLRFTFPESDESGVVIDAFDRGSQVKVMPDSRTVVGYTTRNSGGVPDNFRNWFVIRFDKPFSGFRVFNGKNELKGFEAEGEHALAAVYFTTRRGEQVTARVASSFISEEQALRNLETEVGDADFETVKARAQERWDEVLGRIEVSGGTEEQYRTFYSCLYRSTLFPRKFYEIDAKGNPVHYSPYNGEVLPGYMYTDTGFWDTFRCLFPLLNLVYPSVNAEIQAGLANTYRESGFLPEWASPGHRGCMVGNNSASVVADAILKGVTPAEDVATLYEAMLAGRDKVHPTVSSTGRLGHEYYNTLGYVPYNVGINENAARTLEYAYDDYAVALLADVLGDGANRDMLMKRTSNYKNLFDPSTGLMRGRLDDGSWITPFDDQYPYYEYMYREANAWQQAFFAPHDTEGLIGLYPSREAFGAQLDKLFSIPWKGYEVDNLSGFIGQYCHGNQPDHSFPYLYYFIGRQERSQELLDHILDRFYGMGPEGLALSGMDDAGEMSSWYVFNAIGLYTYSPADPEYIVTVPLFDKVAVSLGDGSHWSIRREGTGRRITGITCGGNPVGGWFVSHDALGKGELVIATSDK